MTNDRHLNRFIKDLFRIDELPELDSYGTKIFEREIRHSYKILRNTAVHSQEVDAWKWDNEYEIVCYGKKHVPTYSIFATIMAHECAHGWCYFHSPINRSQEYPDKIDEEEVAWDVSKIVCKHLNIPFSNKIADLAFEITEMDRKGEIVDESILLKRIPSYYASLILFDLNKSHTSVGLFILLKIKVRTFSNVRSKGRQRSPESLSEPLFTRIFSGSKYFLLKIILII